MQTDTSSCHVILSGCSGGGKSTLLAELGRRGYATVAEPGRRIVAEERRGTGKALPWVDPTAFAKRAIAMAFADRAGVAEADGFVFFDRGLIDAAAALERAAGVPVAQTLQRLPRLHQLVFMTPPWPEIFTTDGTRQHSMAAAVDEYRHLLVVYERLGYTTVILPKADVGARADLVLDRLAVSR